MSKQVQLKVAFDSDLETYVRRHYPQTPYYHILGRSLDARGAGRGKKPTFHYTLELFEQNPEGAEVPSALATSSLPSLKLPARPIIVGAGPAGLFAALRFLDYGISPVVLEQGEPVEQRMVTIARYWKTGQLNPQSNVCFGEGGAGLFSDGKLLTRSKDRAAVAYVMEKIFAFGGPPEVRYQKDPHVGSNLMREIIIRLRQHLHARGVEIRFGARVSELLWNSTKDRLEGVQLDSGESLQSEHILLAIGHSAKELYRQLEQAKVSLQPKGFAVGVRLEHPRDYLDRLQLGNFAGDPRLGAAQYWMTYFDKQTERGVYSFCMCPGGHVIPSAGQSGEIVVNGMSNSGRSGRWSNSAIICSVAPTDWGNTPLGGLAFQEQIERQAYQQSILADPTQAAAGAWKIPALSLGEFLEDRLDARIVLNKQSSSCPSPLVKSLLGPIFPAFILEKLRAAFSDFEQTLPGFSYRDALLLAPETRTSAPLKIVRKENGESISHRGLYPCGEGAGYAGGITSSAIDGLRIVDCICQNQDSMI